LHAEVSFSPKDHRQDLLEGDRKPSPIESWFLEMAFPNPHYYNQSVLLRLKKEVDRLLLQEAIRQLIVHHDGLRINFDPRQKRFFYNNLLLHQPFILEEKTITDAYDPEKELVRICSELKAGFDITGSLLMKGALIRQPGTPGMLFLTAHHLVVDGISWRILLEDLHAAYNTLASHSPVRLPLKTGSLLDWEKALKEYGASGKMRDEQRHWDDMENEEGALSGLPVDFETNDWRAMHSAKVTGTLKKEDTGFLLKDAHQVYRTDVPVLLNVALALALKECTGHACFLTEQESHGRHLTAPDLSRTIGWFTSIYPLRLELEGTSIGGQIRSIKEQLWKTPVHGLGYGIRRYLTGPGRPTQSSPAGLRFNYLGQFGQEWDNDLFVYQPLSTGADTDPSNVMTARIDINSMIMGGLLHLEINYNKLAYLTTTIEKFRDAFINHLLQVLNHIRSEQQIHFTPIDFEAAGLDQEELDALFDTNH
jgi:non-ribosomal peptide synthase protein (TIGR01720 family)